MPNREELEISISNTGEVTINVLGHKGKTCLDMTKSWATLSLMLIIFSLFCLTSCKVAKDVAKESLIESITDPKTGTQVFVKDYDTDPYAINVGKIIKARKKAKKKKTY